MDGLVVRELRDVRESDVFDVEPTENGKYTVSRFVALLNPLL